MSETTHTFKQLQMESYAHGQHGYSHDIRSEDGTNICELFGLNHTSRANAERIVLCCNAHDDLVTALRELWQYVLDNLGDDCGCAGGGYPDHPGAEYADPCATCKTKAALAKAGEK